MISKRHLRHRIKQDIFKNLESREIAKEIHNEKEVKQEIKKFTERPEEKATKKFIKKEEQSAKRKPINTHQLLKGFK